MFEDDDEAIDLGGDRELEPFTEKPHPADVPNVVIPEKVEAPPLTAVEQDYLHTIRDAQEKEQVLAPNFDADTGAVVAPKETALSDAKVMENVDIEVANVNLERLPTEFKSAGGANLARIREVARAEIAQRRTPRIPGVSIGAQGLPVDWFGC